MKKRFGALAVVVAALATVFASTPGGAADGWQVIASNLDNPRGLAFDPNDGSWSGRDGHTGALYVAEAGRGGPGPCGIAAGGEPSCYGPTGALTKVLPGSQRRVVTGLPSVAGPLGFAATGPHDVAIRNGRAYVPVGFGGSPAERAVFGPAGAPLGTLVQARLGDGAWRPVADLTAYEGTFNPDGEDINSNPHATLAPRGHRLVVDAGANDLLDVRHTWGPGSSIKLLSVFPGRLALAPPFLGLPPGTMIPMQSVPTSLTRGPDGALYVGELTGFPFPVGGARVYRVDPRSPAPPKVFATGFTNIIAIEFDADGNLYVLEHRKFGILGPDPTGALIRVAPGGARTEIASTGLVDPTGLAIRGHSAFVSNFGTSPGAGEVVRIALG